jgi:hypothetical protein
MMRNVALGAVIGFGLVVLGLSLWAKDAPPAATDVAPPAATAPAAQPADPMSMPAQHLAPIGVGLKRPAAGPLPPETLARIQMMQRGVQLPDAGAPAPAGP